MRVFPLPCLSCWKIVVKPETFEQLMMLLEWQITEYKGYCKCGMEDRPYVPGNWGGYFYAESYQQGMEIHNKVRAGVDKYLSPDVSVTLKRYCTEFEMQFGPSDIIETALKNGGYNDKLGRSLYIPSEVESITWEKICEDSFEIQHSETEPPKIIATHVIGNWAKKAWKAGDRTVDEFTHGEGFYTPSVTYHDKKVEIKEVTE